MIEFIKRIKGAKTTYMGLAGIVTGVSMIVKGNVELGLFAVINGLSFIFARDGIEKIKKEMEK